ncbi:hypothetical protein GQ57_35940 [Burkholderia sp. MSh2]|nr:hypothetical protein GQ57_35940 [Burkholderia sp. MSh2]
MKESTLELMSGMLLSTLPSILGRETEARGDLNRCARVDARYVIFELPIDMVQTIAGCCCFTRFHLSVAKCRT